MRLRKACIKPFDDRSLDLTGEAGRRYVCDLCGDRDRDLEPGLARLESREPFDPLEWGLSSGSTGGFGNENSRSTNLSFKGVISDGVETRFSSMSKDDLVVILMTSIS